MARRGISIRRAASRISKVMKRRVWALRHSYEIHNSKENMAMMATRLKSVFGWRGYVAREITGGGGVTS